MAVHGKGEASRSPTESRWLRVLGTLNEYQARLVVADRAIELGRGGVSRLARLTGMSRVTITKGVRELRGRKRLKTADAGRVRQPGGGRKKAEQVAPAIGQHLTRILEETTAGDPMSLLKWTSKSTRAIAEELTRLGHPITGVTVGRCLRQMGYSLQANAKAKEGPQHPNRDAQFRYLNQQVKRFRRSGDPAVVNVGVTHDTAEFAVEGIRRWWRLDGRSHYRGAKQLLICADSGGSNGNRPRAWKVELQKLSDELRLPITVCHYPPGTSKWNKIEHRLFSFISLNWKGEPLVNFETIVNLIGGTRTRSGLAVKAVLDTREYPTGVEVSTEQVEALHLQRHAVHPDWNYTLSPSSVG
jgi:Rhodopirellula transposase DDE domain